MRDFSDRMKVRVYGCWVYKLWSFHNHMISQGNSYDVFIHTFVLLKAQTKWVNQLTSFKKKKPGHIWVILFKCTVSAFFSPPNWLKTCYTYVLQLMDFCTKFNLGADVNESFYVNLYSCLLTHPWHSQLRNTQKLPSFLVRKSLKDIHRQAAYPCGKALFLKTSAPYDSQLPQRPRPSAARRKTLKQVTIAIAECWRKPSVNLRQQLSRKP